MQLTDAGERLVAQARTDVWPFVEAAVSDVCEGLEGSLLDQLAELEARLDLDPLDRRALRLREATMEGTAR